MDIKMESLHFKIVGIVSSAEYQKSKFIVEKLRHTFPNRFSMPELMPMLDVAWNEYRDRLRRLNVYGMGAWCSEEPVVVFLKNSDTLIGDSKALEKFIDKTYIMRIYKDFDEMALVGLKNYLEKSGRPYVYFIISILGETIGTLLFQLFIDTVPDTCQNFLNLVNKKRNGYQGTPVHRICKGSWIQFGGFKQKSSILQCENYSMAHNTRGIISMCNDGKHKNNSSQFFISLDPTPWMDQYYVAFGQLVHGDAILHKIEDTPCLNDCPTVPIIVVECGVFNMDNQPSFYLSNEYMKYQKRLERLENQMAEDPDLTKGIYPTDLADSRDEVSNLSITKYKKKMYGV